MNPTVALVAFFLVPFLILLAKSKRRRSINSKIPLLPTVPGLPFLGNILQLGSLPHRSLRELSKKHGSLMLLHLGSIPTLVVSSPQHAQEIMKTHGTIFSSRPSSKVSKILTYNNIDIAFSPYGDCWRQMRRIGTTHLFSQKMVQSFSIIRKEEVAYFLDRIADSALKNNGVVCITEMFTLLVSSILCRVVLGSSMSDDKRRFVCQLVQKNSTFFSVVFFENLFPKLRWLDVLFGLEAKLRNHFNTWDSLFDELIDNHLDRHREDGDGKDTATDFIDILLEMVQDMFAAGTDTSFITLDWSMAEEQLGQLKYLNAVIKEVLRLHPPGPLLLPRESTQSCEVQGYNIPFGAGRRMCPGMPFAISIIELTLANILLRFNWSLPSGNNHEDMNMDDSPGLVTMRKHKLELVPTLVKTN